MAFRFYAAKMRLLFEIAQFFLVHFDRDNVFSLIFAEKYEP